MDEERIEPDHERIEALEERIRALENFCALQQRGLEQAATLLDMHQRTLEGLTGYQPPDPGRAQSN